MPPDPWADGLYLRSVQYKTDANLSARQSIYAFQHPTVDLPARVLDLAAPAASDTVADIGCGNGRYLADLARRGFTGRVLGADLSLGMLRAARDHLNTATAADATCSSSIALISADAAALPLREDAADVTLASHMLYHVPEPAAALSELRRVTRPGGRVLIVLNGAAHLRQLRAALAAARGQDPATLAERVTLDDGEALARSFFPRVTRHDFPAELRIPDPAPIADYIRSMPGTHDHADPDALIEAALSALPVTPTGHRTITTHAGCLIAEFD
ncbi:class I SAM-dependent methyltransferase [Trebonia kvetii]|nr:class I SAM-dependent methyltransferase [Trebonia kvetii]